MNTQQENRNRNNEKLIDDLFSFCKKGEMKKIKTLFSKNANALSNYVIDEAIRIIIRNYNPENKEFNKCLSFLLNLNSNINFKNETQDYATILMEAACSEKLEIIDTIINLFQIKLNTETEPINPQNQKQVKLQSSTQNKKQEALVGKTEAEKAKNLQNIISKKLPDADGSQRLLNLNITDKDGQSVLHKVINSKNLDDTYKFECLKKLISHGAEVNTENLLGFTPLSLALLLGNFSISDYLINNSADINHIIHSNNESMLHCAVRGKNPAVLSLLKGADLKHKNKNGETACELAGNLKLLSFVEFFNKIDSENLEANMNNKIISSMLPINDIINKNYSQVLSHLQELKSYLKTNNAEIRYIWNSLLADYNNFFENEITAGNNTSELNTKIPFGSSKNNTANAAKQAASGKKNRKSSNSSSNANTISLNEENLFDSINNIFDSNLGNNKSRGFFQQKFLRVLENNEKLANETTLHGRTHHYNSGLFWFKMGNYRKSLEEMLKCLKFNKKKNDFIFFINTTLVLINIFQHNSEFNFAAYLLEFLESYVNNNNNSSNMSSKSIGKANASSSPQNLVANSASIDNAEGIKYLNQKALQSLYTQREIITKSNSTEELNCILSILRAKNFLSEERIDEALRHLKEHKRLWNILIIKDEIPILNTLKKIQHCLKMRIHYLNSNINKSLKHLNNLANLGNKGDSLNLSFEISKFNNLGVINLKQKKYSMAAFNFKFALNLLKNSSKSANFDINISELGQNLLFNLGLNYFYERKFDKAYKTLKKIKGTLQLNNPFYFYRLALCCIEMQFELAEKNNRQFCYNDMLEKFEVKNSQFNPNCSSANTNSNNAGNNLEMENLAAENVNNQNKQQSQHDKESKEELGGNRLYNSFYILKNSRTNLKEAELISEATQYLIRVINIIKTFDNNNYKDTSSNLLFPSVLEFFSSYDANSKDSNKPLSASEEGRNNNKKQGLGAKGFKKYRSKSINSILISSYLNLLFCLSLREHWSEMLFYILQVETSNLASESTSFILDNFKMEAYLGLNQYSKVIDILKNNMQVNGNITYNTMDIKGSFLSKISGNISNEINYKIALYANIIKLNFLNNNILEVEKGIVKIIGLYNINPTPNQQIENIILPNFLINILVYYYLIKENYETAISIIRKRKLPTACFTFLVNNISKFAK